MNTSQNYGHPNVNKYTNQTSLQVPQSQGRARPTGPRGPHRSPRRPAAPRLRLRERVRRRRLRKLPAGGPGALQRHHVQHHGGRVPVRLVWLYMCGAVSRSLGFELAIYTHNHTACTATATATRAPSCGAGARPRWSSTARRRSAGGRRASPTPILWSRARPVRQSHMSAHTHSTDPLNPRQISINQPWSSRPGRLLPLPRRGRVHGQRLDAARGLPGRRGYVKFCIYVYTYHPRTYRKTPSPKHAQPLDTVRQPWYA